MEHIKIYDIENAYRKLKSYIYYDNSSFDIRLQIAKYETENDLAKSFRKLHKLLTSAKQLEDAYFRNLLSQIRITVVPKAYKRIEGSKQIISNITSPSPFCLDRLNYLIDAPVELHIISVLWILNEGYLLERTYERYNYGNKLEVNRHQSKVSDGLKLFKKYFEQYQSWRDSSITTAKQLLDDNQDATLVQMDVKGYFHNVSIDFDKVRESLLETEQQSFVLTNLLCEIHKVYGIRLREESSFISTNPLPIGLLSSGILANWCLKGFDERIVHELGPAFYGRYVDDIVIVLANSPIPRITEGDGFAAFLNKYFLERNLLVKEDQNGETEYQIRINDDDDDNHLSIQERKFALIELSHKESRAVLNNFIKKLRENSSVFWLLPEDQKSGQDFDRQASALVYSDSINKLRSIEDVLPSKFGASIFLAKSILSSLLSEQGSSGKRDDQILRFFRGRTLLEMYQLWEKVITYFVVNNKKSQFLIFYKNCRKSIDQIQHDNSSTEEILTKVKNYLVDHLHLVTSLALALDPSFLFKKKTRLHTAMGNLLGEEILQSLRQLIRAWRQSNLMRHNHISIPLLNLTTYSTTAKELGTLIPQSEIQFLNDISPEELEIDYDRIKFMPRYVALFEVSIYKFYLKLLRSTSSVDFPSTNFNATLTDEIGTRSYELYYQLNYEYRDDLSQEFRDRFRAQMFNVEVTGRNTRLVEVGLDKSNHKSEVRIAVANHRINPDDIENSIKNKLELTSRKKNNLIRILNHAEEEKADILLLPELTIPLKWIKRISDEARRKNRVVIGGLEHFSLNRICMNFAITALPMKIEGLQDCLLVPRLKNHYSPEEKFLIRSIRYRVPEIESDYLYHLFKWEGISFTVYNCYELADVNHRSLFRSLVDIVFASEYNKDWKYFSNVAESITRDIHCYYVQSNTSDIGDSRIIQPTDSQNKDILRLKGGIKSTVVSAILNIEKLRHFQEKEYQWQRSNKIFKPTPPNYDHESASNR